MLGQENRPQCGMSPGQGVRAVVGQARLLHLALQARALVVGLLVPSLPRSCCSSLQPAVTLAWLRRGARGRFWLGCAGPGSALEAPRPWRRKGRPVRLHAQRHPNLPPPGPAGALPGAGSQTRGECRRALSSIPIKDFLLQLQPSTVPCSNLPPGDFCGLLVFSQDLLQTWDGEQPGPLQPPRGRSSLPPLLHSPFLHVQVAAPCGPSSGSPGTSYSFWLCSSSHLSVFTSPIQRSSKSQDLLADILLTLPTLSVSATRKVGCEERGCCDHWACRPLLDRWPTTPTTPAACWEWCALLCPPSGVLVIHF